MNPIAMFLLLPSLAFGQSVFKCQGENGVTVFSQRPCADDPAKVEQVDTSRSLKTGSGGSVESQSEFAQLNSVRRNCDNRIASINSRYNAQRGRIGGEIARLEAEASRANNNLAGATWEAGLRQQIAGLMAERGALASAEAQELAAVRAECQEAISSKESEIEAARKARESKQEPEPQQVEGEPEKN